MRKTPKKSLVVANWKMYGSKTMIRDWVYHFSRKLQTLVSETPSLLQKIQAVEIVLCPPVIFLQTLKEEIERCSKECPLFKDSTESTPFQLQHLFKLGAQNAYFEEKGAYTGEVSPSMLTEMDCKYLILGHSERRHKFVETDEWIARKLMAAYHAGLIPIVCIGETEKERAQGKAFEVIDRQLNALFDHAETSLEILQASVIAYEPIWAIGTGQTATPKQAEEVHAHIRSWIENWVANRNREINLERALHYNRDIAASIRILYGGSIKASNAATLFSEPNIDGGLVGGASLDPEDFLNICLSRN